MLARANVEDVTIFHDKCHTLARANVGCSTLTAWNLQIGYDQKWKIEV